MEIGKLTVQARDAIGKGQARQLRKNGLVPGICYGAGIDEPIKIILSPKALKAALDPLKKQNTVIDLTVEGGKGGNVTAMLWDYQIDAIRREVTHVDLIAIDPNKAIEADVPVELTGKAAGAVDGGIMNIARHSVQISAKPADIPSKFVLDISSVHVGEARHVSDLEMPAGVELVSSPKLTILTCVAPRADKSAKGAAAEAEAEGEKKEGEAEKK